MTYEDLLLFVTVTITLYRSSFLFLLWQNFIFMFIIIVDDLLPENTMRVLYELPITWEEVSAVHTFLLYDHFTRWLNYWLLLFSIYFIFYTTHTFISYCFDLVKCYCTSCSCFELRLYYPFSTVLLMILMRWYWQWRSKRYHLNCFIVPLMWLEKVMCA